MTARVKEMFQDNEYFYQECIKITVPLQSKVVGHQILNDHLNVTAFPYANMHGFRWYSNFAARFINVDGITSHTSSTYQ